MSDEQRAPDVSRAYYNWMHKSPCPQCDGPKSPKAKLCGHCQKTMGRFGEFNPCWRGGKSRTKDGYILVRCPEHPEASNGYVLEHRLVWEKHHGRPVPKGWEVHHLNDVHDDNRPDNVFAMAKKGHSEKVWLKALQKRIRTLEAALAELQPKLEVSYAGN